MGKPYWRKLAELSVPEPLGAAWTISIEYVTPGTLIQVKAVGAWTLDGLPACGPDGHIPTSDRSALPLPRAGRGALIARIGGSTADLVAEEKTMLLFVVGRSCVLQVPDDKRGTLFFGVNEKPDTIGRLKGQLTITIEEAI